MQQHDWNMHKYIVSLRLFIFKYKTIITTTTEIVCMAYKNKIVMVHIPKTYIYVHT